jgi:hypothetical protein
MEAETGQIGSGTVVDLNTTWGDQSDLGGVARSAHRCQCVAREEHSSETALPTQTPPKTIYQINSHCDRQDGHSIVDWSCEVRTMTVA